MVWMSLEELKEIYPDEPARDGGDVVFTDPGWVKPGSSIAIPKDEAERAKRKKGVTS